MNFSAETIQPMGPQLVSHGILTIDTLNGSYGIWIPDTSDIIRTINTCHGSASGNVVGQRTVIGEAMGCYRKENYKKYFEIARQDYQLQSKRKNIETSQPPLDSTTVVAKMSYSKTPATESSALKEIAQKYYLPEDPDSDPNSSDSSLSDSGSSGDSNYKHRKRENKKKQWKRKKQDPIKLCPNLTANLLTTAYKSKVLRFKLDQDPLQHWIYFLTFIESLQMIFHSTRKLIWYF